MNYISYGAEISSVTFIEVLKYWHPTIVEYFLDHGADFITDSPFTIAFEHGVRKALLTWRKCRERYPDCAPQLQEQADKGLRYFCRHGDLKWVTRLMWAGANPRSIGPLIDDDDGAEHSNALTFATYGQDVRILKRLKPDAKMDDLGTLLTHAASFAGADVGRHLLELGARLNDKPNGGSTALDYCFDGFGHQIHLDKISSGGYSGLSRAWKSSVPNARSTIQLLLAQGATWRPDGACQLAQVRRDLVDCSPDVTVELVERLKEHAACTDDTIRKLLRTPGIKKHLIPVARELAFLGLYLQQTRP